MSQLSLFAQPRETVVVDDARGRIVYTPEFIPPDVACAWFDEVRGAVAWEAQRRWMYEREVDVPRLVGHFRLRPEDVHVPEAIRAAARRVTATRSTSANGMSSERPTSRTTARAFIVPNVMICATFSRPYFWVT